MNRAVIFAVVAFLLVAGGCGKSTPTNPGPTVSTLSISPATDLVRIRATEKFSATASYVTGVSETVTPSWSSDNQAVATVDTSGAATGAGSGQATITASYQGKSATRALRVVPDYAGRWAGSWTVTACAVQGDFQANWCDPVRGGTFPATLELLQTRDVVSGNWTLQESTGTVQGTIASNGALGLTGSSLQSGVTIDISAWQTTTTDNRAMTGTFVLTWTVPNRSGSARTDLVLQTFTKQ
jgi:hypothetical protein